MLNKKKSINSFHTKYTEYTMCYATTAPINHRHHANKRKPLALKVHLYIGGAMLYHKHPRSPVCKQAARCTTQPSPQDLGPCSLRPSQSGSSQQVALRLLTKVLPLKHAL